MGSRINWCTSNSKPTCVHLSEFHASHSSYYLSQGAKSIVWWTCDYYFRCSRPHQRTDGIISQEVQAKLQTVLAKTRAFLSFGMLLLFSPTKRPAMKLPKFPPNIVALYKFAPITTDDVERSFSQYRYLFNDRRRRLTFKNLLQIFLILCLSSSINDE